LLDADEMMMTSSSSACDLLLLRPKSNKHIPMMMVVVVALLMVLVVIALFGMIAFDTSKGYFFPPLAPSFGKKLKQPPPTKETSAGQVEAEEEKGHKNSHPPPTTTGAGPAKDVNNNKNKNILGFPSDSVLVEQIFSRLRRNMVDDNDDNITLSSSSSSTSSKMAEFSPAFSVTQEQAVFGESELWERYPHHFYPLSTFHLTANDTRDYTVPYSANYTGGVALFEHVYLTGMVPFVYDADTDLLYYPAGCKAERKYPSVAPAIIPDTQVRRQSTTRHNNNNNNVVRIDDTTVVFIAQFWGDTYYHALIEDLPRLAYLWDFIVAHNTTTTTTILCPTGPLMTDDRIAQFWNPLLLRHANVTWRPYDTTGQTIYHIRGRLLIPTGTQCGHGQPLPLNMMRDRLSPSLSSLSTSSSRAPVGNDDDDDDTTAKPIMILVQQRSNRGLANHDELINALTTAAFAPHCTIVVQNDDQTMNEYALLHQHAHLVIAPHGAGLANLVFTRRNVIRGVLELFSTEGNNPITGHTLCHQRTAIALGIPHVSYLIATDHSRFGHRFRIEPDRVVAWVQHVLEAEQLMLPPGGLV
jgi:Glycosyltransferase 61